MGKRRMVLYIRPWHRVRVAVRVAFAVAALAVVSPRPLSAASSVTLAWDPSTSTDIAGYRIYYGRTSLDKTNTVTLGNTTTATISNLVSGATYYFAATAYDTANLESDFSNEVSTNVLDSPTIVLTSPANNASFTKSQGVGTIQNDDAGRRRADALASWRSRRHGLSDEERERESARLC